MCVFENLEKLENCAFYWMNLGPSEWILPQKVPND